MFNNELFDRLHNLIVSAREAVDDKTALIAPELYDGLCEDGSLVEHGTRINWGGVLYKAAVDLWDRPENNPDNAPNLWAKVLIPNPDVIPEWEQPGSTNPYIYGDKVTHNGKTWVSVVVGHNVWEPGVYGWDEIDPYAERSQEVENEHSTENEINN